MGRATRDIPALSPYPINNTVFVDYVHGDDSTGIVERMDKPYKTRAAALTAIAAFYTGASAPSATNRILIKVWSGRSTDILILTNFVDYDLSNGLIETNSFGFSPTVSDNGVPADCIVYGKASFRNIHGDCVVTGGGTVLTMYCMDLYSQVGSVIRNNGGQQIIHCNSIVSDGAGQSIVLNNNGSQTINVTGVNVNGYSIYGSAAAAILLRNIDGFQLIRATGQIAGGGAGSVGMRNSGFGVQTVYGDLYVAGSGISTFGTNNQGTVTLYGNITTGLVCVNGTGTSAGTVTVYGNLTSLTSSGVLEVHAGVFTINGNITTFVGASPGIGAIKAAADTGTLIINNSRITADVGCLYTVYIDDTFAVGTTILNNVTLLSPDPATFAIGTLTPGAAANIYIYGGCQSATANDVGIVELVGVKIVNALVI